MFTAAIILCRFNRIGARYKRATWWNEDAGRRILNGQSDQVHTIGNKEKIIRSKSAITGCIWKTKINSEKKIVLPKSKDLQILTINSR